MPQTAEESPSGEPEAPAASPANVSAGAVGVGRGATELVRLLSQPMPSFAAVQEPSAGTSVLVVFVLLTAGRD